MNKAGNNRKQAGMYDKIFRENMDSALPLGLKNLLGFPVRKQEPLPDNIRHTRERKTDVLRKVTDHRGRSFVVHMEYQVSNDRDMAFRMAEYCIGSSGCWRNYVILI